MMIQVRLIVNHLLTGLLFATVAVAAENSYVGSTVCRGCHPDVWMNFNKNPHFKSIAAGDLPKAQTGCEGCHGPGKNHVEARGGKSSIGAFSLMEARHATDTCLTCHSKDVSRANIRRSSHTMAEVACNNCHSIHKAAGNGKSLLAKRQADLCYGCHANIRALFSMPSKHRVNEGFMQCTDCHNPHGTAAPTWRAGIRPRMVDQALSNEEPCLKCHSDKRGPFAFEHASVRVEGCETCHNPHGSMNKKMLRRPTIMTVCLECHNGTGTFGIQNSGIRTQTGTHNMADPRYQNCTTCHVRIHGSNSDPTFLR